MMHVMEQLLTTTNTVRLSFVMALLRDASIPVFVFDTKKISKQLGHLIKNKKIITKKTKEIDFLKSFKFFNQYGNIKTVKALSRKDTVGVNYLKDLS